MNIITSFANGFSFVACLQNAPARRLTKTLASVLLVFCMLSVATAANAQCTAFHNADEEDPLAHASPAPVQHNGYYFVDIDGDGDLDCYVGGTVGAANPAESVIRLYRNVGTPTQPQYQLSSTTGFANPADAGTGVLAFGDIDGDGDMDVFVTKSTTQDHPFEYIDFFRNTGTAASPVFTEDQTNNPLPQPNFYSRPAISDITLIDLDKNGALDFDLTYTDVGCCGPLPHIEQVYTNASATHPFFTLLTQEIGDVGRSYYDWNHDGYPDFVRDGIYYQNYYGLFQVPVFIATTTGAPTFPAGETPGEFVDLNKDGSPELYTGGHYLSLAPTAAIRYLTLHFSTSFIPELVSQFTGANDTYQWQKNGIVIPGATNFFLLYPGPGKYILRVTNACGTGVSQPFYILGIRSAAAGSSDKIVTTENSAMMTAGGGELSAFPNPFREQITLQLPASDNATTKTIKVWDAAGRIAETQTTSGTTFTVGKKLAAGTYIVQVWQGTVVSYHATIIKQ